MDKVKKDTPKKQHYVPQFLLKHFSFGKKNKIFTFDKAKCRSFPTTVRDSASENGFYNFPINGEKYTLEDKLSKLESVCSTAIKSICKEGSLEGITEDDHTVLCVFMANQLLRVKKQRAVIEQINTMLVRMIEEHGGDPSKIEGFDALDKDGVERVHIESTLALSLELSEKFVSKPLAILRAPKGSYFMISDAPVAMYNHWPRKFRGDKGISVPGVEIQLPISSKLCLSFICPELYNDLIESIALVVSRRDQGLPVEDIDTSYGEALINSVSTGEAYEITEENVIHINSLQIADSLNYVYSEKDDFSLAIEMVQEEPDLASGIVLQTH
jgi:hypothetical protein